MSEIENQGATGTLKLPGKNSILRGMGDVLAFNDAKVSKHVPGANGASTQTVVPKKTSKFSFDNIYASRRASDNDKGTAAGDAPRELIEKSKIVVAESPHDLQEIHEATEHKDTTNFNNFSPRNSRKFEAKAKKSVHESVGDEETNSVRDPSNVKILVEDAEAKPFADAGEK